MAHTDFPDLYHGRPDWPNRDDEHLFWVGLNSHFRYSHRPQPHKPQPLGSPGGTSTEPDVSFFCRPSQVAEQLLSVLHHSAGGGSILVTGYRGTGKTSVVNHCLSEWPERKKKAGDDKHLLPVRVNMATVANAHDVLLLTFATLTRRLDAAEKVKEITASSELTAIVKRLRDDERRLRACKVTEHREPRSGVQFFPSGREDALDLLPPGFSSEQTFEREALSRYQASLVDELRRLKTDAKVDVVFVFDEVDKLLPTDGWEDEKESKMELTSLQKIVAELKHFLSESSAHQIFIAGKDVDDSWAEDQNKGEGIFESIFACNIHVPSIFTLELDPCLDPLPQAVKKEDAEDFYATLAGEMGIPKNSLVFRTALLILPHLAEYEVVQLLTRAHLRDHSPENGKKKQIKAWLEGYASCKTHHEPEMAVWRQDGLKISPPSSGLNRTDWFDLSPTSERTCRRMRVFLEYLTYKGRGVPRKILREFYGMVKPASCVPDADPGYLKLWDNGVNRFDPAPSDPNCLVVKHVLAFPQHHLQKMNFYAAIVEHLDQNFALLRGLNDKGRVSIFHIIDYLLKFYSTGFSHRDLEHAPFMTAREELFPSRQLASLILRIMEGKLWRRKDSRGSEYRMLHHVTHDLGVMFLRYGPEQMELRHTKRDFRDEIPRLEKMLDGTNGVKADERLAPIHAQIRLARIMELCGHNYDARLAYYKALRWLRLDVSHFEQAGASIGRALVVKANSGGHTAAFPPAFVTYTVETHQALGRLLEEVGELRQALQHYEEASSFCEPYLPESPQQSEDINACVKGTATPTWLEYAQALWQTLSSEPVVEINRTQQIEVIDEDLAELLARRPPMRPLQLEGVPNGYVSLCNHAAITYSKLWERSSANRYLLKALFFLDAVGDEYGLVDQMFLTGQMMTRRRDLTAAALWYRAALLKISAIRSHSEKGQGATAGQQWGADWQTPPALATSEAQIMAALGDINYATNGHAFAIAPNPCKEPSEAVWSFIRKELELPGLAVDDRWEEYLFTIARRRFEAGDQDIDARDVYLRQLETRLTRFEQAIGWIEGGKTDTPNRWKYEALNAWTTFWRGARVLLHRNLNAVSSLARNKQLTWGRIANFRSMGTTLRLVGAMLVEIALRKADGDARKLLQEASEALQAEDKPAKEEGANGKPPRERAPVEFYRKFVFASADSGVQNTPGEHGQQEPESSDAVTTPVANSAQPTAEVTEAVVEASKKADGDTKPEPIESILDSAMKAYSVMMAGVLENGTEPALDPQTAEQGADPNQQKQKPLWWTERARIQVNTAARDMLTIFAWIGDRSDLLDKHLPTGGTDKCGHRSPLFRLSGNLTDGLLPVSWLKSELGKATPDAGKGEVELRFKLLAIAEKALVSAYLSYRDTIPDFAYAQTCVQIGELYAVVIYKLGTWSVTCNTPNNGQTEVIATAIDEFSGLAKRFLNKAIDILNREQEQNRNTFHLMSEAWFNLADIMTVRLLAVTGEDSDSTLKCNLFGDGFRAGLKSHFEKVLTNPPDRTKPRVVQDLVPEDLRRQITEAYQNGLRYAQDEMSDYQSRYRVPGEVNYSSRNLMDPVLHFRICRSVRLRHNGGWHDPSRSTSAEMSKAFTTTFEQICDPISGYESPQYSGSGVAAAAPSRAWARQLATLIKLANKVRTDRGPLQWDEKVGPVGLAWLSEETMMDPNKRERFVFFSGAEAGAQRPPTAHSAPSAAKKAARKRAAKKTSRKKR